MRKFYCLLFPFLLLSCRTSPPIMEDFLLAPPASDAVWESSEYRGLKILKTLDDSQPVGGAAFALAVGEFEVILTPADASGQGETRSSYTSVFTRLSDIQVGVNGSPFYKVDILNRSGRPMDIVGVQINEGLMISPPVETLDALYILKDGSLEIGSQSSIPENTENAVGGFRMLLKDGMVLGNQDVRHPRTAVGLSGDGKTFYIAVFDGRQRNRAGMSTLEAALWMRWMGCSTALNLDGGGSTSLVLKNRDGTVHIMNSPIHRGKPGLERAVGNNLGFRLSVP